jgi:mono/diheme cytochrome c family protein
VRYMILCAATLAMVLIGLPASARAQEAAAKSKDAAAGDVPAGKRAFTGAGCVACHGADGKGTTLAPQIAPPPVPLADLIHYVRQPSGKMPPVTSSVVSDRQLANIYAYLQSVAPPSSAGSAAPASGDATKGEKLFIADGCYECHDYEGVGAGTGPRIGPPPISLPSFLRYVRAPSGNMPPYTVKIISDQDLTDIYAYLESLPPQPAASSIPLLSQ